MAQEFGTIVEDEVTPQEFGTIVEDAPAPEPAPDVVEFGEVVEDEPSVKQIVGGVGTELAAGVGGQLAGTAIGTAILPGVGTAIGYTVGSLGSGIAGSIAAQRIEGRDDISWGRALAAGLINLVPGGAARGAKGAAKITGAVVGKAAAREAAKGAAFGATEATSRAIIDEGRLPTKEELAKYGGAGALFGGALGAATPKISKTFDKFLGKTAGEIDDAIASGSITAKELKELHPEMSDADIAKTIGGVQSRKQADNAVSELTKAMQISERGQGKVGKLLASIIPSRYVGPKANQSAIDFKRSVTEAEEIGSRIARRVKTSIEKNPNIEQKVDDFLRGGQSPMDKELYDAVGADLLHFRTKELELQNKMLSLLDEGAYKNMTPEQVKIVQQKVRDSIQGKSYVRREYSAFLDKDFKPDPKLRNAAFSELSASMGPEKAKAHMDKLEKSFASTKASDPKQYSSAATDGILKSKHNVGKAERLWLGEVRDAPERMRGTLSGLGRSVARAEADSKILRELQEAGLASTEKGEGMIEVALRGAAPEGQGVYVNPEVQTALNQIYLPSSDLGSENVFLRGIQDLYSSSVAGSKAAKVLLNTIAYPVQLYGNTTNLIGQGINPFKGASRGAHLALAEFGGVEKLTKSQPARRAMLNDISDMSKYGLKGSNVLESDIRSGLEHGFFSKVLSKATDPLGKAYSVPDTMGRYVGWKANQRTLAKIFPHLDQETIKRQAAHMINDTYQNYDKLSNTVRVLSRWGVMPQFASFTSEFARNQYNQGKIIAQMMRGTYGQDMGLSTSTAGISAMRKEGAKRLAALTAVYGGTYGAIEGVKAASGVDEEKGEALRDLSYAPWDKNRNLLVKLNEDGKTGWTANPSYVVPHALGLSALKAGMNGQDEASVIELLADEFVGEGSFVMQEAFRALANQDEHGRPISNQVDDLKRAQELMKSFLVETFKPGVSREYEKLAKAIGGRGSLTLKEVGARQLGARLNSFDVTDDARFTLKNNNDASKSAKSRYTSLVKYGEPSEQERAAEYEKANQINRDAWDAMRTNNQSMIKLGFDESERVEIMKGANLSSKTILSILDGKYVDLPASTVESSTDQYDALPAGKNERLKAIQGIIRSTPERGKQLLNMWKREQRNVTRGLSERETLFKRLGTEDKVSYLRENPTALLEFQRKGLVNDTVLRAAKQ